MIFSYQSNPAAKLDFRFLWRLLWEIKRGDHLAFQDVFFKKAIKPPIELTILECLKEDDKAISVNLKFDMNTESPEIEFLMPSKHPDYQLIADQCPRNRLLPSGEVSLVVPQQYRDAWDMAVASNEKWIGFQRQPTTMMESKPTHGMHRCSWDWYVFFCFSPHMHSRIEI